MNVLGAAAVTAGLATYMAWPARRASLATRKRQALTEYLQEHLSLSEVAVRMVHRLASRQHPDDRTLFRRLADEFEEDQLVVRALLARLGSSGRSMKRVAGVASGTVVSAMVGGEPGDLALFRTLEALSVGIQGKRCMWRVLQDLPLAPVRGVDFAALEAKAVRQWDAIEQRRRGLVPRTFSVSDTTDRRSNLRGNGIRS